MGWGSLVLPREKPSFSLKTNGIKKLAVSFILFYFIFKLYIIVLFLPNIKMNLPQVY